MALSLRLLFSLSLSFPRSLSLSVSPSMLLRHLSALRPRLFQPCVSSLYRLSTVPVEMPPSPSSAAARLSELRTLMTAAQPELSAYIVPSADAHNVCRTERRERKGEERRTTCLPLSPSFSFFLLSLSLSLSLSLNASLVLYLSTRTQNVPTVAIFLVFLSLFFHSSSFSHFFLSFFLTHFDTRASTSRTLTRVALLSAVLMDLPVRPQSLSFSLFLSHS